jgi:DNA-directed RNA polymerase subunit K/omega
MAPPAFGLGHSAALDPRIHFPGSVRELIRSPGPGEPLTLRTQSALESSFAVDLRAVRVHNDRRSATGVDQLSARAFTVGTHIFLGSRERPTDLALMAHEATHVVQQRGGSTLQRKSAESSGDSLEREADRSAASVQRGEHASISGRTGSPRTQFLFGWVRRGISAIGRGVEAVGSAVGRGVRAAASAVADVAGNIIERAVNYIREHARSIPGYDLLGYILGRDPLTQQPVERNAVNLIRALLGLVPGGSAMFANLQRAHVIERAYQWVTAELAHLNLSWAVIRGAIDRFLATLGPSDLLHLGSVFQRARAIFGPILSRILTFAAAAGRKILEFIFEGALALAGGAAQRVLAIFRRIGATFSLIVNDPVGFLRNLINAVKGGFQRFAANILEHLRTALFEWLFGALAGAGLQLPARFNLQGIISIVLQVLGLTYPRLRARLVRLIGEPAVATLEHVFEFLRILVTQGLAAAWQKILEFATGMVDTVIAAIRNWVISTIVRAAVTRIATMFNPVGAIINAIITIYNTVMFVIERARQIAAFVEAVIDSIDNIAHGNIGAAIAYVERTLARILPLVISFLARLIGLGGISETIRNIIHRIQAVVDRAIDRIVSWVAQRARGLVQAGRQAVGAVLQWWRKRTPFRTRSGQSHSISLEGQPPATRIAVQSNRAYLEEVVARIPAASRGPAESKRQEIERSIRALDREGARGRVGATGDQARLQQLSQTLDTQLQEMAQILAQAGILDGPNVALPRPVYRFNFSGGKAHGATVESLSANRPMGSAPYQNPMGWSYLGASGQIQGAPFYRRLHLINHRLGGLGQIQNLVPGSQANNSRMEADYENPIKQKVGDEPMRAGKTAVVWMRVGVAYNHPAGVLHSAAGGSTANRSDFPSDIDCTWEYVDNPADTTRRAGHPVHLDVPAPA